MTPSTCSVVGCSAPGVHHWMRTVRVGPPAGDVFEDVWATYCDAHDDREREAAGISPRQTVGDTGGK